jgi:hypothetical protein
MRWGVATIALVGCNAIANIEPATLRVAGDDASADAPPPACDPSKDFGAPARIAELDTAADEGIPRLTHDGLAIYFMRDRDLYVARRSSPSDAFGPAVALDMVNSTSLESNPTPTGDDLTLYFASDRPGGKGGTDIWMATRATTADSFSSPTNVSELNTAGDDDTPYVLANDLVLYFARKSNDFDLLRAYRSSRQDRFNVDSPGVFKNVNTTGGVTHWEFAPVVTPDEKTLYFVSDVNIEWDIFVSVYDDAANVFGKAVPVRNVSSTTADLCGWISDDGCRLYLLSDRDQMQGDMYVATKPQ